MNDIKVESVGVYLHVIFPFALNDQFRDVFKTAQWDGVNKAWVVKKNKINLNKIDLFAEKTASARQQIAQLDEIEMTDKEIAELEEKLAKLEVRMAEMMVNQSGLKEKLTKLDELKERYADNYAEAHRVSEENIAYQKLIKERVEEALKHHDVEAKIKKLIWTARQGHSTTVRRSFGGTQHELRMIYDEVEKASGLELNALYRLSIIKWYNKGDYNLSDMASKLYTDVDFVEHSAIETQPTH